MRIYLREIKVNDLALFLLFFYIWGIKCLHFYWNIKFNNKFTGIENVKISFFEYSDLEIFNAERFLAFRHAFSFRLLNLC